MNTQAEAIIRELLGDSPEEKTAAEKTVEVPTQDSDGYLKLATELEKMAEEGNDEPSEPFEFSDDIEKVAYNTIIQDALNQVLSNLLGGKDE